MQISFIKLVKIKFFAVLAVSLCAVQFYAPLPAQAATSVNYVVQTAPYRDNYILTQLFYSVFSVDDLTPMQELVGRGLEEYPEDFPRFMSLTIELVKNPDARLFMLLAPLASHMADPEKPDNLDAVMRLTNILSGKILPDGGKPEMPSLKSRIKFYDDSPRYPGAAQVPDLQQSRSHISAAAEADMPSAPPVPSDDVAVPKSAHVNGQGEQIVFLRNDFPEKGGPTSELLWLSKRFSSRAACYSLADNFIWGSIYTNLGSKTDDIPAFFAVRDGIISFAMPKNISESDFYADGQARPHRTDAQDPASMAWRQAGSELRPCEMSVVTRPRDDALPPELSVRLEQSNAGLDNSDFICIPQCSLTYSWSAEGYVLSGKSCAQGGWGVWPYNDASHPRRNPKQEPPLERGAR